MNPYTFACYIVALSEQWPITCTGWGRSWRFAGTRSKTCERNHLGWMAVDVEIDCDADRMKFLTAVHAMGLSAIDVGDHIHIEAEQL